MLRRSALQVMRPLMLAQACLACTLAETIKVIDRKQARHYSCTDHTPAGTMTPKTRLSGTLQLGTPMPWSKHVCRRCQRQTLTVPFCEAADLVCPLVCIRQLVVVLKL